MKGEERRSHARVSPDPAATLAVTRASRTVFPESRLSCQIINLSSRGVQFASSVPFLLRERISLEVAFPSWKKILSLEGEVVWLQTVPGQGVRIGARYLGIDPKALRKLASLAATDSFSM